MSTATAARQRTRTAERDRTADSTRTSGRTGHRHVATSTAGSVGAPSRRRTSPVRRRGSRQQLTVRGRRVTVPTAAERSVVWTWVVLLALFVAGVALAMYLSGKTTEQSFQLSEARDTSTSLSNELESLNRDVQDASSTQRIAAEAAEMGMVVPGQAGVLNVEGDRIDEVRPSDPSETRPVTDINGDARPQRPTSDPDATGQVPGLAPHALDNGDNGAAGADGAAPAEGTGDNGDGAAPQPQAPAPTGELPY